ncbi:hypothetical protein ABQW55_012560 [Xanthomonas citri pv. malvacearum]|uniref:Uncharacterized protein n=1 Tax=Xanthomonas campestris pv. malvacearum TaxID=86040 RepID=A0AA44YXW0_XANCM|nr:hypothetical protein [Xanthomonas citri]ASN01575.1 hypothetical protein APY29_12355 [Xanthomonas citri pv. malvacearum]ASN09299.1 hypothetical protein APY30_09645 [Xanthomonas citri pv. malvacearum]ASY84819.1 hypothetical protein CIW71_13340 [Xanthomonas citri pv. malvacearum]MCC4631098.1 hypothetical protein [Xanthomonas citri]PUE89880.1 hypothetical protein C7T86_22710 [Xanthomonas citri pv. malvacearum]
MALIGLLVSVRENGVEPNALLEAEIRSDPPAWLLWPALDRRVTDFDYGQARSGRAAVPAA